MASKTDAVALHFVPTDGGTWAGFLKTKLSEKRYGINVVFFNANYDLKTDFPHGANILLVSPDFLSLKSFEKYSVFDPSTSLIVLLGTSEEEYKDACHKRKGDSILNWPIFETQQNESSVRALLVEIIDLYEQAHSKDVAGSDESDLDNSSQISEFSETDPGYDPLPPPRPVKPTAKPPSKLAEPNTPNYMVKAWTSGDQKVIVKESLSLSFSLC